MERRLRAEKLAAGLLGISFLLESCGGSPPPSTITPTSAVTRTAVATDGITETPVPTATVTSMPSSTPSPSPSATGVLENVAACVPSTTKVESGQVSRVIDGDTIEVLIGGQSFRVRYIGMDTPETGDRFGDEATGANADLVRGQTVTLVKDVSETDRYGRLLRYVFVREVFVNRELVLEGYATASTYPPDVACAEAFLEAQRAAVAAASGLWAAGQPPSGEGTEVATPAGNCDPSYPTVCIPPPPPDLDCGQITYRLFVVLPLDPHRFDGDHDGVGCEGG